MIKLKNGLLLISKPIVSEKNTKEYQVKEEILYQAKAYLDILYYKKHNPTLFLTSQSFTSFIHRIVKTEDYTRQVKLIDEAVAIILEANVSEDKEGYKGLQITSEILDVLNLHITEIPYVPLPLRLNEESEQIISLFKGKFYARTVDDFLGFKTIVVTSQGKEYCFASQNSQVNQPFYLNQQPYFKSNFAAPIETIEDYFKNRGFTPLEVWGMLKKIIEEKSGRKIRY